MGASKTATVCGINVNLELISRESQMEWVRDVLKLLNATVFSLIQNIQFKQLHNKSQMQFIFIDSKRNKEVKRTNTKDNGVNLYNLGRSLVGSNGGSLKLVGDYSRMKATSKFQLKATLTSSFFSSTFVPLIAPFSSWVVSVVPFV